MKLPSTLRKPGSLRTAGDSVLRLRRANDNSSSPGSTARILPGIPALLKVLMDRSGALLALFLLSPVFVALALLVRRDGGPVFYGQRRIGRGGREFRCWKFRSMVPDAEHILQDLLERDPEAKAEWARDFKLRNDPRITKIGSLLRKTSIDELPQLWNVLVGEMSLVGPRPVTRSELENYGVNARDYLAVRPGMTGLWQVSGRNDVSYAQRVEMDSEYVRNWSLVRDIVIIFRTVGVMLKKQGAY